MRNGQGTQTHSDGRKYVGEYKDGKKNGQGTMTSTLGDKFVGECKDGKENGWGTWSYPSGSKYEGEWKDGKEWNGNFYDKNGKYGLRDASHHLILLVKDEKGYKNLLKLVTAGFTEGFYYKPRIDKEFLAQHSEGLIALSCCNQGEI